MASRLTPILAAVSLAATIVGCSAPGDAHRRPSMGPNPVAPEWLRDQLADTPTYHLATYDVNRLDAAIHHYAADRAGRLPAGLSALATEKAPGGDPYLKQVPTDPWGAPYVYAVLDARLGTYDLRSYGPDRLPGTDDDVVARADPVPFD